MQRNEILENIEDEIKEFLEIYELSSEKARPYKISGIADRILCYLEGIGAYKNRDALLDSMMEAPKTECKTCHCGAKPKK